MARIYYKTVFSGHGGRDRGDSINVVQNSLTTALVFDCFFEDGEERLFEAGDVVTAIFRDVSDESEYISAGTFTPDIGTNQFTWVQDDTDVGTPGDYRLAFEVTGATPAISILVDYSIEKVPNGTISPMSPLVGMSIEERAWVVSAIGYNPTPATWLVLGDEIPLYFPARNATGVTIPAVRAVMFSGTLGASGKVLIQPAIADDSMPPSYTVGITIADIANGADDNVLWFGKVESVDTTGAAYGEAWADGDLIYTSATTSGYLTNVKPTGADRAIELAVVLYAHATQGILLARPTWHPKLTELDGVSGSPSTTGDLLTFNAAIGVFEFVDNTGDFDVAGSAAAAQAYAIQRANHTGTQLLATISDVGTMAGEAASDYHSKTDFSSSPTADEPLKADGAGGIAFGGDVDVSGDINVAADGAVLMGVSRYSSNAFSPILKMQKARGTINSPLPILSGDSIFRMQAIGRVSTSDWSAIDNRGNTIQATATEDWSPSATGRMIEFLTIANGSTSAGVRVAIGEDGGVFLYSVKSGSTQAASGASADEIWSTSGHATLPDNVLMIGV